MRVLVLGASGMLGHTACRVLGQDFEVWGTLRSAWDAYPGLGAFLPQRRSIERLDPLQTDCLATTLSSVSPDVVVNGIGIVKQSHLARDSIASIKTNALFPHQLAALCAVADAHLIHISTDCVFSGKRGNYNEDDFPDPVDLYGRTKLLGEVASDKGLTIRTSIVGRQLVGKSGLFEWFLNNAEPSVRGYRRAAFSGLTTNALAEVMAAYIRAGQWRFGLYHVASERITKFELLLRLRDALAIDLEVRPDDHLVCDRSLDGRAFSVATGLVVPGWDAMLEQLAGERALYL